jgi:signal transduction histidine kinase/ketosteroid isomerase-like protein
MKMTKQQEKEIMRVYNAYWDNYLQGDVEAMQLLLDDEYTQVGSAEGEVFLNKKDAVQFLYDTIDQVAGKLEMRNRSTILEQQGELILIHERCDLYALADGDWIFYSKFRASTLQKEKKQGWKITHQHSSFPDARAEDGENIAINKIAAENLQLREAVKRRTIELEQKNHELEIEAALEKVRSRAMSMHNSSELKEVALELRKQIGLLGQKDLEVCAIHLYDEEHSFESWSAMKVPGSEAEILQAQARFPNTGIRIINELMQHYNSGSKDYILVNEGEKTIEWFNVLKEHAPEMHTSILQAIGKVPILKLRANWSVADFTGGALVMVTYGEPDAPTRNLLRRSANVFEQAYIRFLDLQKAEVQTREAQIELGLERVRARAMAMQHSNELAELVDTVFKELIRLNFLMKRCQIIIVNSDGSSMRNWMANSEIDKTPNSYLISVNDHPYFQSLIKAWKVKQSKWVYNLNGDEKNELVNYVFSHTEFSNLPEMVKNGMIQTKNIYFNASYNNFGSLQVDTLEPLNEENLDILKRFGNVFDYTYKRFNDLKKAEAQAREAEIELALERVRARTMAMHNSVDVGETVATLFYELVKLGVHTNRCGILINSEGSLHAEVWTAKSNPAGKANLIIGQLDLTMHPLLTGIYQAWKSKEPVFIYPMIGDDLIAYYQAINDTKYYPTLFDLDALPLKEFHTDFYFAEGSIFAFTPELLTEEASTIFKRFAGVFGQTYTRFLDLQKAEAQAKEAMIEAALERVRSRSMAMHKSEELADLSHELVKQVQSLAIDTWFCAFNIYDDDPQGSLEWGSNSKGTFPKYRTPREGIFLSYYEAGRKGETLLINDIGENECAAHYEYLCTLPGVGEQLLKMKADGIPFPSSQIDHVAFFKYGYIIFITYEPVSEAHDTFKRFAKVFEQTYTRFLDLKRAEAQALQAEQDLVEIKIARKKAEDTLTELKATQAQLIQAEKMASLGELTAGIAHEIQNPLNFVNNFSDVSSELLDEMMEEIAKGNFDEVKEILNDVKQNLEKINHHGKRADAIVKGMLQHSRSSNGIKEPTDINALCDEYLRLSYHGLRAKDKSFNAILKTDFDESIGNVNIIPQDIGRVILNLITNAFYVVDEKKKSGVENYEPTVSVSTSKIGEKVTIKVIDNGNGIPQKVLSKIFQPFFTTKPTGQGTGLGLSLSYDIVKAHGGELMVETREGEGSQFTFYLPLA